MSKRRGLWVRLDVNFQDDPRLLRAGPMAELLFLRGLALVKRRKTDGLIATEHLPALSAGFPGRDAGRRAADALVREGAWLTHQQCQCDARAMHARCTTSAGWRVHAWSAWNETAQELDAKRLAGQKGNHDRWHAEKQSVDCPYCHPAIIAASNGATPHESIHDPNRT